MLRRISYESKGVGAVGQGFKVNDEEEARQEMVEMTKSAIWLALMSLLLGLPHAFAQAQTKESAHGFLASVINKGIVRGQSEKHHIFTKYEGRECAAQLTINSTYPEDTSVFKSGNNNNISLDWSAVANTGKNGKEIWVSGIVAVNKDVHQAMFFRADSETMADRILKAFEFLRMQCDKTKQFGF